MKVIVNRTNIEIFSGAKVIDVIRAYYIKRKINIPNKLPQVYDKYGNIVALDGEVKEGSKLKIK